MTRTLVIVDTPEKAQQAAEELGPVVAIDTETNGIDPYTCKLVCTSFCGGERTAYVCMWDKLDLVKPVLKDRRAVFHNAAYDIPVLNRHGVDVNFYADSMVLDWLVDPAQRHGLKELSKRILGAERASFEKEFEGYVTKKTRFNRFFDLLEAFPGFKDKLCIYAAQDAADTFDIFRHLHGLLVKRGYWDTYRQYDHKMVRILMEMHERGILVDKRHLRWMDYELRYKALRAAKIFRQMVNRPAININSGPQLVELFFGQAGLNLPVIAQTDKGNPALTSEVLETFAEDGVLAAQVLREHRTADKIRGTFVQGILDKLDPKGFIHTDFRMTSSGFDEDTGGTVSGRLTCVAGDTLLPTTRGVFVFEEYVPEAGDKVVSHKGNLCRVLRKIYKGVDTMYRVRLDSGSEIKCTGDHRLLTPEGWKKLKELSTGSEVCGVHLQSIYQRTGKCAAGFGCLPERREANGRGCCKTSGNDAPHCYVDFTAPFGPPAFQGRENAAIFQKQNGASQSDDRENSRAAPQLDRRCERRQGLSDDDCGRREILQAPDCFCGDAGHSRIPASREPGYSSHRSEPAEQRPKQLGSCHDNRACGVACQTHKITEIALVGPMATWDIEVEGDHSYCAQGMIHHNSQGPNLQNIPSVRKKDPHRVRKAFIAQPGCVLVVGDFSQAELRVLAHFSLDPVMVKAFQDDDDLHSISAKKFYGLDCALEEVKKLHDDLRAKAKTLNFAIMYGMAALSLASRLKIEIDEAERLLREYFGLYSGVQRWMMQNIGSCRNKGYVETILGRRRYLPDINSQDNGLRGGAERRATNSPIQGSVADLIKIAMVRLWEQHPWIVMRLQVHDELVCEVPKEREAEAKQLLGYVMEHAVDGLGFKVPWKASVSSGPNWDEAKG